MHRKYSFFLLLSVFFFAVAPLWPIQAIEYGGIGGRPGKPREDEPRSESIFTHHVAGGQTVEESVLVINNSNERKTLYVYGADSTPSTDGSFACEQRAEEANDVGSWLQFGQPVLEVELEPKTKQLIPFNIVVPENPTPGEHNGCILIEDKKKSKADGTPSGIHLALRTGIRVRLTVSGRIIRGLEIVGFSSEVMPDRLVVIKPEIRNDGNVSVDANMNVVVRNFFGREVLNFGGKYTILRDDTSKWNFEFPTPFYGLWYKTTMEVSYDDESELITLGAKQLEFFVLPEQNVIVATFATVSVVVPLMLLFFARKFVWWRRRRYWPKYIVRDGDDIMKIAKHRQVAWKILVKVNKLKPPYVLVSGQKVQVPPQGTHVRW
jgi:hypothetical protein